MTRCTRPDWGADAARLKVQVLKWRKPGSQRFRANYWGRIRWQQLRAKRELSVKLSLRRSARQGHKWGPYREKLFNRYCTNITRTLALRAEIRVALSQEVQP